MTKILFILIHLIINFLLCQLDIQTLTLFNLLLIIGLNLILILTD